ncbi:MAG: ribonuclease PH [Pelagibacterales bacterium]|nr:ribonuclease PH [Pelagibacterales bacterium]
MRKNRKINELRKIEIIPNFSPNAEGSCLIKCGETHVLCNASVDENIPRWLKGQDRGWITAEYGMLPRSTLDRMNRESKLGKQSGRTQEIQRLIGRSLRSVTDLHKLKNYQVIIDCDVLQADGGTRTAAITGAFIALKLCINKLIKQKKIKSDPITESLAAISCGVIENETYLDLDYSEDLGAEVDANFVITENEKLVEIQMTSEERLCSEDNFQQMLTIAKNGIKQLIEIQKKILSN